jgi:hypothetical protein
VALPQRRQNASMPRSRRLMSSSSAR